MCTPQGIIEKIGCLICNEAVQKAIKAASYVRHYKANLDNLEAEMSKLENRLETIIRKVREAEDHGDVVEAAVSHWLTEVDRMKGGFQELVGQKTAEKNMHCFVCSCPNIKWRYRLGKLAEERTEAVKELTQDSHFDEISHSKPPPPELEFPSNENFVTFGSRTPILKAIMNALNDPKVNMIGVHGLGGVGKTRLVEEVRKQMRENGTFKKTPLAAIGKNPNVKDIQSKLAGELFFPLDAAADDKIRAKQLWNKFFNGERYLVILDDIWQDVDLKAIGIPITDGKTGCKVVLTSRNEGLLKKIKVDRSFPVAELSEREAWALFKKKVGNSADSPEISLLASKMCQKCKGLPVAINALGAALEGKPLHAWQNALDKLERCMLTNIEGIDPSVFASLRLTYDMLHSEDAKSCFLMCCLFPEDAQIPIDDLMRHCVAGRLLALTPRTLDEARNAVHTVVDTLKSYYLLSDGREGNVFQIHDVIRDIGIKIARDEKAFLVEDGIRHWPETPENGLFYSVISARSGNINQLPDELAYSQLHTLIFEHSNYPRLKVPDRFFSGMKKLTVLVFNGMCLLPLPTSLAQLENLRMLCLNQCELGDINILGHLKTKLEILSLRGSDIKALPPEIGQLTGLQLLDLRDCNKLTVIPQGVIINLTKLEALYIPDRFGKWEATTDKKQDTSSNVGLEELRSLNDQLTTLHIHIPDVMLLPKKQLKFENLKSFKISVGSMFGPDEGFSGTSILKLERIPLKDEFKALVDKAEVLYLQGLEGMKKVLAKPKSGSFSVLRVLVIQSCRNLKYLFSPSCARELLLERLEIKSCSMEEIIDGEEDEDEDELTKKVCFSKLKYMLLQELPKILSFYPQKDKTASMNRKFSPHSQSLFNEKVVFPALEELKIIELPQITQIFDKELLTEESFHHLRDVQLRGCELLVNVFPSNMLSRLQNLEKISVQFCENMEVIISMKREEEYDEADTKDNIIMLPQLRTLRLDVLDNLRSFYSSRCEAQPLFNKQVVFPALEELEIIELPQITQIFDKELLTEESFRQLRNVDLWRCKLLVNVFPSNMLSRLQNLQTISVAFCENMEVIISMKREEEYDEAETKDNIILLPQLRTLRLADLYNLKSFYYSRSEAQPLFNKLVVFPALEELEIIELLKIAHIFDKEWLTEESFRQLRDVHLRGCKLLVNVFPSNMLPRLQNLQKISVYLCENMKVIISMKREEEYDEAKIKDNIIMLPQLRTLRLLDLNNLKSFYSSRCEVQPLFNKQVIFPVLEVLDIRGLPNITEIWDKQSLSIQDKAESFEHEKLMNAKEEVANDDIFVFSQLRCLYIVDMMNLKSFCTNSKILEAQPFFDHQVAFPSLERLFMEDVPNITEIWDKQPLLDTKNEIESFYKLNYIKIKKCGNLVNVFPYFMLPQLQINLEELLIILCPKVDVIVSKNAKEKEDITKDIIEFQKLMILKLKGLENLKSFCAEAQLLFDKKVIFPVLEVLDIRGLPNITEIWDKQSLSIQDKAESFEREKLMNAKEEVANDDIFVFSQLRVLYIVDMLNLKSFCTNSKILEAQPFFDHQVIFPGLVELEICGLPNITEIWDKQSLSVQGKAESFCQLVRMHVFDCEKLINLIPSSIVPRLQNLVDLVVRKCPNVEVIVFENAKQEVSNDDIFVFSQLRFLYIVDMMNLKSFCPNSKLSEAQPFFNHQVIFPGLEELEICGLPNITEIWDKQSLSVQDKAESFCQLVRMHVFDCEKMMNLIPSNVVPRLQNLVDLVVLKCSNIEVIVFENANQEVAIDDIFVFSQLRFLYIVDMMDLKSFCTNSKISEAQPFFNHQVAFPSLETLLIQDVPNITEIWDKQPLLGTKNKTESFYKLNCIEIMECGNLVNVFPYYMLPQLQINLLRLEITSCSKVEVIVSKKAKEKEAATKDIIVFQKLTSLKLEGLENLKSFCFEAQLFLDNKDTFPVLEDIEIVENLKIFREGTSAEEKCASNGEEAEDHFSNID